MRATYRTHRQKALLRIVITRRLFLACVIVAGLVAPASANDETGIADWIRSGAEEFLKDMGVKTHSLRDEAVKVKEWQETLVAGANPEALAEMQRLAQRGHSGAINFIGWLLDNGMGGVPRDSAKAAIYFKRAGERGEDNGAYNLALLKVHGRGVKRAQQEAIDVFVRLDRKGHELASFQLGRHAEIQGKHADAARFFAKASLGRKHPYAIFKSGFYTFTGSGAGMGSRDRKSGLMMIERAAGLWSHEAMAALVEIHAKGIFVQSNPVEAAKWLVLLQQNPYLKDRASLPMLRGSFSITTEQFKQAERNASIWRAHHPVEAAGEPMNYDRTVYR